MKIKRFEIDIRWIIFPLVLILMILLKKLDIIPAVIIYLSGIYRHNIIIKK